MAPRSRRPPPAAAAAGATSIALVALLLSLPAAKAQQSEQQQRQQVPADGLSPAAQAAAQLEAALRASVDLPATEANLLPPTQPPDSVGTAAVTLRDVQRGGLCQSGQPAVPVVERTIGEAHAAMLAGRLTCSGLVGAYLQRIDARLGLNSIRAVNPGAVQRAAELDVELAALRGNGSAALPPLFCVPLLVKDNMDVQGCATTAGCAALLDNFPPADAPAVARLQQRGALVLAKTSMGEMAFFPAFCLSSVSGVVRNPFRLSHTPGGSSGGSAAAAAASLGMAALGTDTGNSVRGPASHAALVGLRPSLGLVSRAGLVPLRADRDAAGPMARTVEDAVRLFEAMVGPDREDPLAQPLLNATLPANYSQFLDAGGLRGARIGVLRQISELPGTHPAIAALFEAALRSLARGGAALVEGFAIRGNRLGLDWEAGRGGEGPAIGHWNVGGRWEDLWACQSPFRDGLNAYLAAGNTSTRRRSLADIYRSGEHHPEVAEELLAALAAPYTADSYPTAAMRTAGLACGCSWWWTDPCRTEFRQNLIESMDAAGVDAVVYPTWSRPPLRVGERSADSWDGNNSPMVAPHTGSPAITVPMGFYDGLPTGLSFLGRPFDEPTIIRLAYAFEQATQHRRPPPLLPECRGALADDAAASPTAG